MGSRARIDSNVAVFFCYIGPGGITNNELYRIGARRTVDHGRILRGGGQAVAEVPGPEKGFVGRLVGEMDGQGATTCGRGSGKVGDRGLGLGVNEPKHEAGDHK